MIDKLIKENKNKIIFLTILLFGLPVSVSSAYFLAFQGKIYPRVFVCQTSLVGKNIQETKLTLSSFLQKNEPVTILLSYQGQTFPLNPKLANYLPDATAKKALKQGREKFPLLNLKKIVFLLLKGRDLSFDFQIDNNRLDTEIASVSAKLYIPPIDPQIKIVRQPKKQVIVETGKNGQELDQRLLKQQLFMLFSCPQKEVTLEVVVREISPKISQQTAENIQRKASAFLNKEIKLLLDDQSWIIGDEEIISFLSFENNFDRPKIELFVKELAKTINTSPKDASLHFEKEQNRVTIFEPSKDGIVLKEKELVDIILDKLSQIEISQENKEIFLPVTKVPPKITTADANSLGIAELLGKGTSLFRGSISERIHNIELASRRLNGILIPSGEIFSFNNSLGDVSQNTGFKQAYIIKEGRTVLGDGGGVCQVSTTLFRAALNAGLPITERHAHAYRVHYYEDDIGPGFDATVFAPTFDLKFINNTPAYILIQSSIDLQKKQLSFEIYGTRDNRQVEISKARIWDKQPPPPDLYQDDPTLPIGVVKQVDWKAWGSKVSFDYKVTKGNEILFEKTFLSIYRPWQAVYLRGTKQ